MDGDAHPYISGPRCPPISDRPQRRILFRLIGHDHEVESHQPELALDVAGAHTEDRPPGRQLVERHERLRRHQRQFADRPEFI